jgi:tetrahydromethanopterin S-methyltransferase subunit G
MVYAGDYRMAFTIEDLQSLLNLLRENQELRTQLRQALLNGEKQPPSDAIDRLAEEIRLLSQEVRLLTGRMDYQEQRTDERFNQVDQRIDQFEQRTDERFNQVDERFNQVDQRIDQFEQRTDERFHQVDERFNQVDQRFDQMDQTMQSMNNRIGTLIGESMELRYRNHIGAFFGRVLKRTRVVEIGSLQDTLPRETFLKLLQLDLLARGRVEDHPDQPEVWLAMEISAIINTNDVIRVRQRADILLQAGYPTIAIAAGEECSRDAAELAWQTNVVIMQDGGEMTGWDAALANVL